MTDETPRTGAPEGGSWSGWLIARSTYVEKLDRDMVDIDDALWAMSNEHQRLREAAAAPPEPSRWGHSEMREQISGKEVDRQLAAAPPEPPRLHGVAIRGDYGVTCSCGAVLEWPEGWTRRTDTSAGRVVARHAGYPPFTDWPPPEPPRPDPEAERLQDLQDANPSLPPELPRPDDPALYDFEAPMQPQCFYVVHGFACRLDADHPGLHSPGRLAAPKGQPLDVERIDNAMQYAIAYMNDPEGLAGSREEWRDQLREALHHLRLGSPGDDR